MFSELVIKQTLMKKQLYIILALIILSSCEQRIKNAEEHFNVDSIAQTEVTVVNREPDKRVESPLDTLSEGLKSLIPSGYSIINTSSGDLNGDGLTDHILVLERTEKATTTKDTKPIPQKRPLLLFLGQSDGSYTLEVRNDNMIGTVDSEGMFGDPFVGIVIHKEHFSIEHGVAGGQHWKNTIRFKYDHEKENWFLYEDHFVSYKFNESDDPDAEALVVDVDKLKTERDFGVISIYDYKYD